MWNRRFICLWGGQTLANLGDVIYIVAFISAIYSVTASVMYTALVPVVILTAQSLGGLTAPLLFQRLTLPQMLVLSQSVKTILLATAAVVVPMAPEAGKVIVWVLFALGWAIAFMDGWANPARNALVPRLVTGTELMRANGLLATSDQTVFFAGWAAGGLLVATFGDGVVLWGTVLAYTVATIAMLGVSPRMDMEKPEPVQAKTDHAKMDWRAGWMLIRDTPLVRSVVAMDVLIGLSSAVWIAAIMLPFVKDELGRGEEWWGYLNASYMLGSIAGGALLLANAQRLRHQLPRWIVIGTIGSGVVTLCFGSSTNPLIALFFSFALGPMYQMQMISKQTLLQQATAVDRLPYVLSAKGTIDSLVFGISALIMGAVAEWLGTRTVYFLSAGILGVAVLFAWRLRQHSPMMVEKTEG
ncbi:arabinose ABC transporter permease [Brevibacillus choshinensis]|uniref:Arabinose ABC transporter permease n=1 Tax=Brevibacillus choshinensis TaxID=54911 RepID=A0ABR5N2Y3_BRECH|nr:MFS transporter [Brevibacillus choshinensis]KQL44849.1 arabinose ABC transporter permease [Brevibacillus choshinensis]